MIVIAERVYWGLEMNYLDYNKPKVGRIPTSPDARAKMGLFSFIVHDDK